MHNNAKTKKLLYLLLRKRTWQLVSIIIFSNKTSWQNSSRTYRDFNFQKSLQNRAAYHSTGGIETSQLSYVPVWDNWEHLALIVKRLWWFSCGKEGEQGSSVFQHHPLSIFKTYSLLCLPALACSDIADRAACQKKTNQNQKLVEHCSIFQRATRSVKCSRRGSIATAGPNLLYYMQCFLRPLDFGCSH